MLRACIGIPALAALAAAQSWPVNLANTPVASGWSQATGVACAADGRVFVWEKAGRVWCVENGTKALVLDIAEEVGDWRDHGLLGLALDPGFLANGRIYLLYVVDHHHLVHHGTPAYDPAVSTYFRDTIGRVTRYACTAASGFRTVDPASRAVLVGESITTGIPVCNQSHGLGSLVFGADGTLLVSTGDNASYDQVDEGGPALGSSDTALAEGILRPEEDVGAFRAQMLGSLDGKILRIDPATGDGVPSNPFFDATAPRAARSRVWALGFRNPFRMVLRPGTGNPDPASGEPGTLYVTDVGWNTREELDLCDRPGLNFGWPLFEGLTAQPLYAGSDAQNLETANPLFPQAGCTLPHFRFRDLLVQETLGPPAWPNPCDPAQEVPASVPRFEHARPVIDWSPFAAAQVPAWIGNDAHELDVGAPGAAVQGAQFQGACGVALAWYSGTNFPAPWRDTLFFTDHATGWIQSAAVDAGGRPTALEVFAPAGVATAPVCGAFDPTSGALYVIEYWVGGDQAVRRLEFVANQPPVARATPDVSFGPAPLSVAFTGSTSTDPEGHPLTYDWDFGDGAGSDLADPVHVFELLDDVTADGTFVGRILELVPPVPLGSGNPDPEVLRDGDRPPVGNFENWRQFDTFHNGDQGALDWIGYALPAARELVGLTFQEGRHFPDGGWFATLGVEVGDGTSWTPVTGLVVTPAYPGDNGLAYETFELRFQPVVGTHVRLVGVPGGSAGFVSAGELRVLATPSAGATPTLRDVTLTVTDPYYATSITHVIVSLANTPPQVAITSPVDGGSYSIGGPSVVPLSATVTDAEHGPAELACAWQTILHHDEHSHAEPIDAQCTTAAPIEPLGCDGNLYSYEFRLTVTDAAGLATTRSVFLWPDCCASAGPPHYCTFCSGDGTATACPCGTGYPASGCPSSMNPEGAHLEARGTAQVAADTLELAASGLPDSAALFFQGTDDANGGAGTVFGDGLLCLDGTLVRLRTKTIVGGTVRYPEAGDPPLSIRGQIPAAGGTRSYQAWYRNAAAFCTSATFNTTNGVRVAWAP